MALPPEGGVHPPSASVHAIGSTNQFPEVLLPHARGPSSTAWNKRYRT
jgi:hypothetical protein